MKTQFILLILALLSTTVFAQKDRKVNEDENLGYKYFKDGNYEEAIVSFNKAILNSPKNRLLIKKRADCYYKLAKYKLSINDCNLIIDLSKKCDSLCIAGKLLKGSNLEKLNQLSSAKEIYKEILNFNPNEFNTLVFLGSLYGDLNQYDSCQFFLLKANKIQPTSIGPIVNPVFYGNELGNYKIALEYGQKYSSLFQDSVWKAVNLNNMGYSKLMLDQVEEGFSLIDESIQLYPSNSFAYKNRGIYYITKMDYNSACKDFEIAKNLGGFHITKELIEKYCSK